MGDIQSWTKVVTDPLGLAGFALFLVFGFLAKVGLGKGQRWLAVAAVLMAFVALLGGMGLSWTKSKPVAESAHSAPGAPAAAPAGTQTTHGAQSPAVQNVQGDVIIKMDQKERKP